MSRMFASQYGPRFRIALDQARGTRRTRLKRKPSEAAQWLIAQYGNISFNDALNLAQDAEQQPVKGNRMPYPPQPQGQQPNPMQQAAAPAQNTNPKLDPRMAKLAAIVNQMCVLMASNGYGSGKADPDAPDPKQAAAHARVAQENPVNEDADPDDIGLQQSGKDEGPGIGKTRPEDRSTFDAMFPQAKRIGDSDLADLSLANPRLSNQEAAGPAVNKPRDFGGVTPNDPRSRPTADSMMQSKVEMDSAGEKSFAKLYGDSIKQFKRR